MAHTADDLFFYFGKIADRLCAIDAAAGTSGNISIRADDFPLSQFPEAGNRDVGEHELGKKFPNLAGQRFVITGSGKNLRYIAERPHESLALIEILGDRYKILWGLDENEVITSEHPAHLMTYSRRSDVTAFIHAQPTSVNVFARLFHDEESMNRLLSVQHEQLRTFSPAGIGLIDALRHGSYELADAVSASLEEKDICAVIRHGTFAVGEGRPVAALNAACDLQEYYHDAARTFLDNPWLRLLPIDSIVRNLGRVARFPLGDRVVNAFLRSPR
jgi:rhamnulose-1-phosphate aldolase